MKEITLETKEKYTPEALKQIAESEDDISLNIGTEAALCTNPALEENDEYYYYFGAVKDLSGFENLLNITAMRFGMYVDRRISFAPLLRFTSLRKLVFDITFTGKTQYVLINNQKELRELTVQVIDLSCIQRNVSMENFTVPAIRKNEELLSFLFPNLKQFTLQADSTRTNFDFLNALENLEEITIVYSTRMTSFPVLKNPGKIKSIRLIHCYSFVDIESILIYKNLEDFALTTYNKKLQLSIDSFSKLKQLLKLKTVYTVWGKTEPESVRDIYKETGWIKNQMQTPKTN
jgi:hypothetical protein